MIRLISRPGLLTGVVVAASVVSGIAFGAMAMTAALLAREAARRMRGER